MSHSKLMNESKHFFPSHFPLFSHASSESRISGLVHPERPLGPLLAFWCHGAYRAQPAVPHHRGTLPRRCSTVPFGLPHPLQTPAGERPTGSLCEYLFMSVLVHLFMSAVCDYIFITPTYRVMAAGEYTQNLRRLTNFSEEAVMKSFLTKCSEN